MYANKNLNSVVCLFLFSPSESRLYRTLFMQESQTHVCMCLLTRTWEKKNLNLSQGSQRTSVTKNNKKQTNHKICKFCHRPRAVRCTSELFHRSSGCVVLVVVLPGDTPPTRSHVDLLWFAFETQKFDFSPVWPAGLLENCKQNFLCLCFWLFL